MNVCYIVLHYQNVLDTIDCVDSVIRNHGDGELFICVVDNCSQNDSFEDIKKKYRNIKGVYFCSNNRNLGFANGMNSGMIFMSNKGFIGFYVLLNNDTILDSNNWDYVINEKYNLYHFGVLGPDCYSENKEKHFNPFYEQKTDLESLKGLIKYKRKEILLNKLFIRQLFALFQKKVTDNFGEFDGYTKINSHNDILDVPLQGSCLILSPDYYNVYHGLYSKTFLYFEEAILRHRCKKINKLFVLTYDLKLIHKCSAVIKNSISSERKRELFYLKNSLFSIKTFYKDVKENKE